MFQPTDPGAPASKVPRTASPRRDPARIVVYGSLLACDRIIKHLHVLHFAEPNDWTEPLPTGRPGEWMRMVTKNLLIE